MANTTPISFSIDPNNREVEKKAVLDYFDRNGYLWNSSDKITDRTYGDIATCIGWHLKSKHGIIWGRDTDGFLNVRPASTLLKQSTLQFIKKVLQDEKETKDS